MFKQAFSSISIVSCAVALCVSAAGCDSKKPEQGQVAEAEAAEAGEGEAGEAGAGEAEVEGEGEAATAPDLTTTEGKIAVAAAVAGAISKDPANADQILEDKGLDREKLDELMYEIASDPDMREQYAVAYANARGETSTG